MRVSKFYLSTLKEAPAEADVTSQKLMLRAGLIRKLGTGLYTWMPLGLITLRKVEQIIREEMNRAGALELVMPVVQPAELWQETGRWEKMGPNMLRLKDRHERDFVVGPDARGGDHRHRAQGDPQLPPAAGELLPDPDQVPRRDPPALRRDARARVRHEGRLLVRRRRGRHAALVPGRCTTPTRASSRAWASTFRAVDADTGAIGGNVSHEFQVLADAGEDAIAYSDGSDYAANVEKAEALAPAHPRAAPRRGHGQGAHARASRRARRWRSCSACRCRAP